MNRWRALLFVPLLAVLVCVHPRPLVAKGAKAKAARTWAGERAKRRKKAEKHAVRIGEGKQFQKKKLGPAIRKGLEWLARRQASDGGWRVRLSQAMDSDRARLFASSDVGRAIYDVGVTGLATTAILVAGYDGTGPDALDAIVRRALDYLLKQQDEEGCFGPRVTSDVRQQIAPQGVSRFRADGKHELTPLEFTVGKRGVFSYNHATATLALIEAYAVTGSVAYRDAARKGIDLILSIRTPGLGWHYGTAQVSSNTSVTAWMALVLWTARSVHEMEMAAGAAESLLVDPSRITQAMDGVRAWLEKATDADFATVGYMRRGRSPSREEGLDRFEMARSEAPTAMGGCCRLFMGERRSSRLNKTAAEFSMGRPKWSEISGGIDFVYWHFGTLFMHQIGGVPWRKWAGEAAVLTGQKEDGSWPPVDAWSRAGGPVYATAINVLTLQTRSRYARASK